MSYASHMTGRWCGGCHRQVAASRDLSMITLHSVLLLCTCGLWFPVWLLVCLFSKAYRCNHCGAKV
jgi:hypothetical protein